MARRAVVTKASNALKALGTAFLLFIAWTSCAWCAETAGTVKTASGAVTVTRGAGTPLTVSVGQRVFPGDRIVTGNDGYVGVTMRDDSRFTIGPKSEFAIRDFDFDATTYQGSIGVSF